MNGSPARSEERLLQLLADRATEGLGVKNGKEMEDLLAANPPCDEFCLDRAAAAIDLAMSPPATESLPGPLRDRILTDAGRFLGAARGGQSTLADQPEPSVVPINRFLRRSPSRVAWYLAAASMALAVIGWWQVLSLSEPSAADMPAQYAKFVRESASLIRATWVGKEPGYEGVSGEVVWSDADQRGFMRLVGLLPNDANVAQYQLWIVDPNRDEHPIDGGVFDVRTTGEALIPIDAKLPVDDPQVFAITLERPGGVVVSGGPLLVVGAVTG